MLPVVLWDPDEATTEKALDGERRGTPVWCAGSVQRRFWASGGESRSSRVEIVAHDIQFRDDITKEDIDGNIEEGTAV